MLDLLVAIGASHAGLQPLLIAVILTTAATAFVLNGRLNHLMTVIAGLMGLTTFIFPWFMADMAKEEFKAITQLAGFGCRTPKVRLCTNGAVGMAWHGAHAAWCSARCGQTRWRQGMP